MTYLLHLETATKVCSVGLSLNGELVKLAESNDDQYAHGEKLTLYIEKVLKDAGISPGHLAGVSVASGPGSYTGLRIGVATAKGLCFALGIPLIAIDALTSLSEIARSKYPNRTLCSLIDARRMEVYSQLINEQGEIVKPISADIITEDSYKEFDSFVYFGDGAEKLTEIWGKRDVSADLSIRSSAIGQVQLAFKKFNEQAFEDVAYFEPFYLKDFVGGKKKA